MAEGKSGAGKIILIVVIVLAVLGAICCGGAWMMGRDFVPLGMAMGSTAQRIQAEHGPGTVFQPVADDEYAPAADGDPEMKMVLVFGVREELTPERIAELQDAFWVIYSEEFAEGGGYPASRLGVGTASPNGMVTGWRETAVTVEALAERTGKPIPKVNEGMRNAMKNE